MLSLTAERVRLKKFSQRKLRSYQQWFEQSQAKTTSVAMLVSKP
jgi:hypothetical protein